MKQLRLCCAGGLVRRLRHLARDPRGQMVSEYVALAAVLVLTGLLLSGTLGRGLRAFVSGAVLNVRTIAPWGGAKWDIDAGPARAWSAGRDALMGVGRHGFLDVEPSSSLGSTRMRPGPKSGKLARFAADSEGNI